MRNLLAILGLAVIVAGSPIQLDVGQIQLKTDGRIVGGESTSINKVPYQVSIQFMGSHFCGGTIISKEWVLTAGHCSTYAARLCTIRAGSTAYGSGGTVHKVVEIIQHQNYTTLAAGVPFNDIGLYRVKEPFVFDDVHQPIDLFDENEESVPGSYVVATGWGTTNTGRPSVLQTVTVPLVAKDDCNEAYKYYGGIPAGQICAASPEGGKDACQGDSGGPLTLDGRLAGIVSWGMGCGVRGYPGVYTEVASYRKWVQETAGI